jgi:Spy/CpxP family protein refolding chaperone
VKRNWLLYLVIFSLALNLGTIGTFAFLRHEDQQQQAEVQATPTPPLRALWRELNLDNTQRQTLRELFPEHRRKVGEIKQELGRKRQELFNLIQNDATPMSAIKAKVKEISALQGSLEEEMVRFMLAFRKILNPQQQAAFLSRLQTHLCGSDSACGPMGPGFGGHRGPGMGHSRGHGMGMGRGMGPGSALESAPPPGEGPK